MALVSIKIKELDNAKKYAGKARDEAEDYRDALYDKIITKMNSYSGSGSSYISTAKRLVNDKRSELSDKGDSFRTLGNDIGTLKTNIVNAETQLTNKIEQVVGNFCSKYDLKSERSFWEKLCDFLVPDWKEDFFKRVSVAFKNWYRYKGGKEFMGMVGKVLLFVGAVVALVAACIALPGLVAALGAALAAGAGVLSATAALVGGIASVITLTIGLATAVVQVGYAIQSFCAATGGDPIWGRRYSTHANEEDVFSSLRRNGQYEFATALEITNIVASVASIITSFINLGVSLHNAGGLKNFFKNGIANIKNNLKNFKVDPAKMAKTLFFKDGKTILGTIKNGLKMMSNTWSIIEGGAETLLGRDPNAFVNSLLKSFGSTLDIAVGYLNKLSTRDLFVDSYEKFQGDANKAWKEPNHDVLQRRADAAYGFLKDFEFKTSTGEMITTVLKNIPSLVTQVQDLVIGGGLTLTDFQYDNGKRFEDGLKSFSSFEKILPKAFEMTGIQMPKGWMDGIVKTAFSVTIDMAIIKGTTMAGIGIVNAFT